MTPHDIESLAQVVQRHGIAACEVHDDKLGTSIKLWLRPGTPVAQTSESTTANTPGGAVHAAKLLRSPGMGRFALLHPLQERAPVTSGQRVKAGQAVGYLVAGSLISEITAPEAAILGRQLAFDGALLGYGDVVFELS